jgi:anti-sigma regulatory factor (Ser/Thr protein kinase)
VTTPRWFAGPLSGHREGVRDPSVGASENGWNAITLRANTGAPREARRALPALVGPVDLRSAAFRDLAVLVSELVTNAVLHSGTELVQVAVRPGDRLRVSVLDHGGGLPRLADDQRDVGGWGLRLVDQLTAGWGIIPVRGGKAVWFDLVTESSDATRVVVPVDTGPGRDNERDGAADDRTVAADAREALADAREALADAREALADAREDQISLWEMGLHDLQQQLDDLAIDLGSTVDTARRERAEIARSRAALRRSSDALDRRAARLDRESAAATRQPTASESHTEIYDG